MERGHKFSFWLEHLSLWGPRIAFLTRRVTGVTYDGLEPGDRLRRLLLWRAILQGPFPSAWYLYI